MIDLIFNCKYTFKHILIQTLGVADQLSPQDCEDV